MGKSRPTPPPTPDPNELINAQSQANRITQFTPYGNLRFGFVGDQGQFVEGAVPDDGRAAAFTQETPFQTQLRAATEGTGLGLGNLAFERVTGRTVIGQDDAGNPIYQDDPDFQNPFRTAPSLADITTAQDIDPTKAADLAAFTSSIATTDLRPTTIKTDNLTSLISDPETLR